LGKHSKNMERTNFTNWFDYKPLLLGLMIVGSTLSGARAQRLDSLNVIPAGKQAVKLTLDLSKKGAAVNPIFAGLMTEEINYSYDGGLYAELIQNRIFKNDKKNPAHWSVVADGDAVGTIALDESQAINKSLTVCLKLEATKAGKRVGIANDGWWGIAVKPSTTYKASFWAKADKTAGPFIVAIESNDGAVTFAKATIAKVSDQWQKYSVTLVTGKDVKPSKENRFVITTTNTGTYWFNLVSLFPPTYKNTANGNRTDLMQLLADMKPHFLRFPGGNFLEGPTIKDHFPWKETLGDLENRPGHAGSWGYRATDGMGLLEFLMWCEDLNMEPVLAVYAGYSLSKEHVEAGPLMEPFVTEALDEIEYVTGDVTTKWGAQRAKDGHPKPFKLTYVELGNEDFFDKTGSYEGRFAQLFDAIRAKYPKLQLMATTPVKSRVPDLVDEHYYRNAIDFYGQAFQYDKYDRKGPKIFCGEWATREGTPTTNFNSAMGDAAWMTGMERNADIVQIHCFAPLFVNVNPKTDKYPSGMQWASDLIGYDILNSYGSPAYYTQKMFNTYMGNAVVVSSATNIPSQDLAPPARRNSTTPPPTRKVASFFYSVTRNTKTGTIYLKLVNTAPVAQTVDISLNGAKSVKPEGTAVLLSAEKTTDTNTITEPTKIVPITTKVKGLASNMTRTLAPYSINILKIEAN
jgi:alpha-N-arabinofuranosidase